MEGDKRDQVLLEITEKAAEKLAGHMRQNGGGKAVRIVARRGG